MTARVRIAHGTGAGISKVGSGSVNLRQTMLDASSAGIGTVRGLEFSGAGQATILRSDIFGGDGSIQSSSITNIAASGLTGAPTGGGTFRCAAAYNVNSSYALFTATCT